MGIYCSIFSCFFFGSFLIFFLIRSKKAVSLRRQPYDYIHMVKNTLFLLLIVRTFLIIRLIGDTTMIIVFLNQLKFFVREKMQQNIAQHKKSLTPFNIFVLLYIIFAVTLEFCCFFIRSAFAPLILIDHDHTLPIP